jgi:hypothetical protein
VSRKEVIMAIKKRIVIILALLTFIVPIGSAIAADFHFAYFIVDYRFYEDSGVDEYLLFPNVSTNNPALNVYVQNVPNATEDIMIFFQPGWKSVIQQYNLFSKYLYDPLPGPAWEGREYQFYIDENNNGGFDEEIDTATSYYIIPDSIIPMDLVQNVTISGTHNPVITWDDVVESERVNFYRIRLFPVIDGKPDFSTLYHNKYIPINASGSYSYTYNGCHFYQHETLAVVIESWERIGGVVNRSRYVVIHNAGPLYTQEEVDQIIADAEAAKDETIDSLVATLLKKSNADANAAYAVKNLAQDAIEKANDGGGKAKEIVKAEKEMEKAQKELDHTKKDGTPDPKYDKAIDHYKKAWEKAQKAMK